MMLKNGLAYRLYKGETMNLTIQPVNKQLDLYLTNIKRTVSLSTYTAYSNKLKQFVEWYGDYKATGTTRDTLLDYKAHLVSHLSSSKSVNFYLTTIRRFFTWLYENDYIDSNPADKIKNVKVSDTHSKSSLSKYELPLLIEAINNGGDRNRLIVILGLFQGLRINELCNIQVKDFSSINGDEILYLLRKGYTTKENYTILNPKAYIEVIRFIDDNSLSEDDYLFKSAKSGSKITTESMSRIIKDLFIEAGIKKPSLTAHSLRHTFSVNALENGADILDLSVSLNHKSVSTTMVYVRGLDRHKRSIEKLVSFDI